MTMKIRSIRSREFSVFPELDLEFSSGINVLIGSNGTGKSHLLKLLYASWKTAEMHMGQERAAFESFLTARLRGLFRPEEGGSVVWSDGL